MAMKSTDYNERIERAEAQLKKWKAEKKRLATKEVICSPLGRQVKK